MIPLYYRAHESERPDALIKDATAVALVRQIDYGWSRFKKQSGDQAVTIIRM